MRRLYEERRSEDALGFGASERASVRARRSERLAAMTYEEILETKVIFGTPDQVIDRLAQFKETLGLTGAV